MNKIFFLFLILLIGTLLIFSDNLMDNFIISSTFCDYRNDHFHTGMDLAGEDRNLYAINDFELIFTNNNKKGSIKYGNGNFAIFESLDHKYRYNYSHIKENTLDINKIQYKKGSIVALSGNSGYSTGAHLHFEVENIIEAKIINPLEFVEFNDTLKPLINDIYVVENEKRISILNYSNYNIKKNSKLFINCFDKINDSKFILTPNIITVYINGIEASKIKFDFLKKLNNQFVIENGKNFSDLYKNLENNDYYIMDINSIPGTIGLKVVIEDYKGNKTIFTRPIKIIL